MKPLASSPAPSCSTVASWAISTETAQDAKGVLLGDLNVAVTSAALSADLSLDASGFAMHNGRLQGYLTRETLAGSDLPHWMRQVTVPGGAVRTKPRALNFAL